MTGLGGRTSALAGLAALSLLAACAGEQAKAPEAQSADVFAARWPANTDGGSVGPTRAVTPAAHPTPPLPRQPPRSAQRRGNIVEARLSTPEAQKLPTAPAHGVAEAKTELAHFATAPFPYDGPGAQLPSGRVLRTGRSYSDDRVLMHIPENFDISAPAVMVVFFHGHRAELERDVLERQQVPAQISMSGINAVLVAPQFAVDAADSNPGRFGERGGFARFIAESGKQLAKLYGDPKKARQFETLPVVIVAYSGGYLPAAVVVERGGIGKKLRGIVLLDALYGETDAFTKWIKQSPRNFFVTAYTSSTKRRNEALARVLAEQHIAYSTTLDGPLWRGRVAILATDTGVNHNDFVTRAWTENPIKDVLTKLN